MASANPFAAGNLDALYKKTDINIDYVIFWNKRLGNGINGDVVKCERKSDHEKFALKLLRDHEQSKCEVALMLECRAESHVVQLIDVYDNHICRPRFDESTGASLPSVDLQPQKYYILVMELMRGGELFSQISKRKKFTEVQASAIVRMMVRPLIFLHNRNIAHRDLKPENFLYRQEGDDAELCLADFGFAKIDAGGSLSTPLYTPFYVPAEILEAQNVSHLKKTGMLPGSHTFFYDKSCDMWSLGVIIYILLCGYPPFQSENPNTTLSKKMVQKIMTGDVVFHKDYWHGVSDDAKIVIKGLICLDQGVRMTAHQLSVHPWVTGISAQQIELMTPINFLQSVEERKAHQDDMHQVQTEMRRPAFRLDDVAGSALARKRAAAMGASAGATPPFLTPASTPQPIGAASNAFMHPTATTCDQPSNAKTVAIPQRGRYVEVVKCKLNLNLMIICC